MTTASKITIARIGLIPFFMVAALIFPSRHSAGYAGYDFIDGIALGIFLIAALTDSLDGYVARKYDQVSNFGKFIDPIADKLLITAALLVLVERGMIASWVCFVVVAREFLVSGLRLVAAEKGIVIAAGMSGKIKTAASVVCVALMLSPLYLVSLLPWLSLNDICIVVILTTTVYSGVEYFIVNRSALKD